ncbi:hypothetical protein F2Q69_00030957 [Brassica cretica]|uniref:Uncharacterized protein n=1 Tax=Brassica cretica TaxID=69181 RepID=A0A8S9RS47_BRACR|nr:hypothetical protein F2Q69_00030957 [Brassica cretica]
MVHRVIEANDSGSVRQTTYLGSRLAVDNLPGSRLVNAEVIFAIDFEIYNGSRLARYTRAVIRSSKRSQASTRDQCSSSDVAGTTLHRPWLSEIYRVSESPQNISQASRISSGSAKKARLLRKALCVSKRELQFTQAYD